MVFFPFQKLLCLWFQRHGKIMMRWTQLKLLFTNGQDVKWSRGMVQHCSLLLTADIVVPIWIETVYVHADTMFWMTTESFAPLRSGPSWLIQNVSCRKGGCSRGKCFSSIP